MLAFAVYFDHDLWIIHVSAKGIHWDIFSKTLQDTVLEMFYTCVNNVWIQVFITWALNVIIQCIGIQFSTCTRYASK